MTNAEQQIATSVLVIGTGGSGLRAAIELPEQESASWSLASGRRPTRTPLWRPVASTQR
jgi:succinate dehydrogenase / fumarate reductase, flavoprotein subunit